jgi:hypothetical protein
MAAQTSSAQPFCIACRGKEIFLKKKDIEKRKRIKTRRNIRK